MTNNQPVEKLVRQYNGTLDVHSIFYTIQGEGPFCGVPAVFVRLAGCNLQCPLCDTEYTSGRHALTPDEIVGIVYDACGRRKGLVVLTGGEPLRQPVGPLLDALCDAGYYVQIETNGTMPLPDMRTRYSFNPNDMRGVYIVCSPKTGKVHHNIWMVACCAKYVLDAGDAAADDGLPQRALGHVANPRLARPPRWWYRAIYVQPADHKDEEANRANIQAAVASCMKHGYTLQLQIHKYAELE